MRQAGLNLLACRMPENVLLLSGYWPLTGVSILLFPIDADPICILPSTEEQEAAFSLGGMRYITYPDGTLAAGNPGGCHYEDPHGASSEASTPEGGDGGQLRDYGSARERR